MEDLVNRAHTRLLDHPEAEEARQYLVERGVSQAQVAAHTLGFSGTLPVEVCSVEFEAWMGHWPGKLIFPLRSPLGLVIGLQVRSLPRPEAQRTYHQFYAFPGRAYMFGLETALEAIWRTKRVVITEGVFDALAVERVEPAVVAVLTARVPAACQQFFRRYVREVVALLDMDDAGRAGAYALAGRAPLAFGGRLTPAKVLRIPPFAVRVPHYAAKDPGELLLHGRLDDLRKMLA